MSPKVVHLGIPCGPGIYPCNVTGAGMAAGNAGFIVICLPLGPVGFIVSNGFISSIFFSLNVGFNDAWSLVFKFGTGIGNYTHITFHNVKYVQTGWGCFPRIKGIRPGKSTWPCIRTGYYVVSVNNMNVWIISAIGKYVSNTYHLISFQ